MSVWNRVKDSHFDVDWGIEDDSCLLRGIHQYGMGSWEALKMDPSLGLGDKILPQEPERKPQGKHLQTRAEYLLKVLKKRSEASRKGVGTTASRPRKPRKGREQSKVLSRAIIENDNMSSDEGGQSQAQGVASSNVAAPAVGAKKGKRAKKNDDENEDDDNKQRKEKRRAGNSGASRRNKDSGPMHFTANSEPKALDIMGYLDPSVFYACKEKMRPVKTALKALDNPDQTISEKDQVSHTRECLLRIGDQINECLREYGRDRERAKEWRSNLWYFVSRFTDFDAKKLYKLYKHAVRKSGEDGGKEKKVKEEGKEKGVKRRADDEGGGRGSEHRHHQSKRSSRQSDASSKEDRSSAPSAQPNPPSSAAPGANSSSAGSAPHPPHQKDRSPLPLPHQKERAPLAPPHGPHGPQNSSQQPSPSMTGTPPTSSSSSSQSSQNQAAYNKHRHEYGDGAHRRHDFRQGDGRWSRDAGKRYGGGDYKRDRDGGYQRGYRRGRERDREHHIHDKRGYPHPCPPGGGGFNPYNAMPFMHGGGGGGGMYPGNVGTGSSSGDGPPPHTPLPK